MTVSATCQHMARQAHEAMVKRLQEMLTEKTDAAETIASDLSPKLAEAQEEARAAKEVAAKAIAKVRGIVIALRSLSHPNLVLAFLVLVQLLLKLKPFRLSAHYCCLQCIPDTDEGRHGASKVDGNRPRQPRAQHQGE